MYPFFTASNVARVHRVSKGSHTELSKEEQKCRAFTNNYENCNEDLFQQRPECVPHCDLYFRNVLRDQKLAVLPEIEPTEEDIYRLISYYIQYFDVEKIKYLVKRYQVVLTRQMKMNLIHLASYLSTYLNSFHNFTSIFFTTAS
jgi:hypothetical protein